MVQTVPTHLLKTLVPIYQNNSPSFLIDTVLEGIAGRAYVDQLKKPHVSMLVYADIVAFGGDASHLNALDLIEQLPFEKGILPLPTGWEDLLRKRFGPQIVELERYSFSDKLLSLDHMEKIVNNRPLEYELHKIDAAIAEMVLSAPSPVREDHVHNYGSVDRFLTLGRGYCLLEEGKIISIASSYASCAKGIEIQINTEETYRGKGLAMVVAAALIKDCLQNDQAAHWDAANPTSARLAERLGYTPTGQYKMLVRVPNA